MKNKKNKEISLGGWLLIGLIVTFGLTVLFASITIIDQTEVGVVKVLGKVKTEELDAGLHFIAPFITQVVKMPVYEKTIEFGDATNKASLDSIKALTSEGLSVHYDMAIQYRINPIKADEVYSNLKNYEVWMVNQVRATARDLIAEYKADDLYTGNRAKVQADFETELVNRFESYGIEVKAVLIRNIDLPENVEESINLKIEAKQEAEKMEFVIQKEKLERDRKVIEAEGISQANEIISDSLTNNYLTWYWIGSLENHNSAIYVPIGNNGLPIFKNVDSINGGE